MRIAARMRPRTNDDITATTNENLAVRGCAAPNSFDTRTLHIISKILKWLKLNAFKITFKGMLSIT